MQRSSPPQAGCPPGQPEPRVSGPHSRLPAYLREEPRYYWPVPPQPPSSRRRVPLGWILLAVLLVVVPGSAAVLAFSTEEVVALEPARPGILAAFQLPGVSRVAVADQAVLEAEPSPDRQLALPVADGPAFASPPGGGVRGYADQPVQWRACDDDLCATVLAPLDWERPDDRGIWLTMRKVRSGDASRGAVFVNPGGPGIEGQSDAIGLPTGLWRGYDVIGWDPRGTGQSTPVQCGGPRPSTGCASWTTHPTTTPNVARWSSSARAARALTNTWPRSCGKVGSPTASAARTDRLPTPAIFGWPRGAAIVSACLPP